MTRRLPGALPVVLLAAMLGPPTLGPAPATAQAMINLRDADLRAFIGDVSKMTGASFVIDPRVQGKVSVVSERPLDRAAYFELFLATLRANGFVAVPMGANQYRIQPAEAGASGGTGATRFATAVIPLATIDGAQAQEALRPVLSRAGTISASRTGNSLVITDFADNIAAARAVLREIDRDRTTAEIVPVDNAGTRELAQSLTALVAASEGTRANVTIVPVDASNAIAIRGEPAQVGRLAAMARDLDRRAATGSEVRVVFLQQADAANVLPVLQQLMGQQPTPGGSDSGLATAPAGTPFGSGGSRSERGGGGAAGGAPAAAPASALTQSAVGVASGDPRRQAIIARYEGGNALIISAPADAQRQLGEVIRQLDTRRAQVQVEAIIVEISDTAARQLGVQFMLSGTNGSIPFVATNYSNAAPNILALAGAIGAEKGTIKEGAAADAFRQAAVASLLGTGGGLAPTGGTAGGFGNLGNNAIFGFVVNAVKNDTDSNILSTPSVLTLDNQSARILVGQEIPVTTGEALGNNLDNSFRTVQRQDVGIQLAVKPQINAGGTITLSIKQVVSSIASTVAERDFVLNKREIETAVTVGDGQIIALGGLLDDTQKRSVERVPLLGDIPGVGALFRSKTNSHQKTNLMVFIRPTIVRSQAQSDALTASRWDGVRRQQIGRDGYASLDALAYDYLRTAPPAPEGARPKPVAPEGKQRR
jgi:general secretion pathway protein D